MENEDKRINRKEPITDFDAAGSESPPNGRILVKIKVPRMPEEAEEKTVAAPPPPTCLAEETKSHYCKECDRSFSCGKALGGHMSSAHVQANKDHLYKKLSSSMKSQHKGSAPTAAVVAHNICVICGKVFLSRKSLFGHMRSHPNRGWRGMEPPPSPSKLKIDSPGTSSEPELEQSPDGYEEDDQIDSGFPTATVGCNLAGWPTDIKRGRGPINPNIRAHGSSSEVRETLVAEHRLVRLLGGELGKKKCRPVVGPLATEGAESDVGLLYKKRITGSGVQKLRIQEREAIDTAVKVGRKMVNEGRGKAKDLKLEHQNSDTGFTSNLPDDIDINDESVLGAVFVLMNGRRNQMPNQNRFLPESMKETFISSIQEFSDFRVLADTKTEIIPRKEKEDSRVLEESKREIITSRNQEKGDSRVFAESKREIVTSRNQEKGDPRVFAESKREIITSRNQEKGDSRVFAESKRKFITNPEQENGNSSVLAGSKREIICPKKEKGDSDEKFTCNICGRSFSSHQALGGHTASHNKFKLTIINTADQNSSTPKEKKRRRSKAKIQATEKVALFDLNMMPEEEDKDNDGNTFNLTS